MPHDQIRSALAELVRLKDIKERIEAGKASNIERGEYSFHKEAAWENARAALRAQPAAGTPQAIYGPGRELIGFDQSAAVTVSGDEREAFEAAYAAHLNRQSIHAKLGAANYTPEEIASMREGDSYDESTPYLNGCWAGWKFARAALAAPAAPQEQPSDEDLMRVFREACEHADHCNQGFSYGRAQALRAVFNLARYGAVPQPGEDAQPVAWRGAQQIADLPAVHEALEAFSHDSTEDNAVGLVQAVLEASPQPAPRAAPQVREDAQPVAWLYRGTHHGIALELNRIDNFYAHPKGGFIKGEPLYITPRPAGRDARKVPDGP